MLDLGDPDQPKSATKAGLKQELAAQGEELQFMEEDNTRLTVGIQKEQSKCRGLRKKQTAIIKKRVVAKKAKIQDRAAAKIESVQSSARDEAERDMGEEWAKDIAHIKQLKVDHDPQPYLTTLAQP